MRAGVRLAFVLIVATVAAACSPRGDPERGAQLYNQTTIEGTSAPGCTTCHSPEPGVVKVGPSHAGIGTRAGERIHDPAYVGEATSAEGYIRESILEPNAFIVPGFEPGVMYQKYAEVLTDQQLDDLVAYLMTLK